jgi:serine/threonine protein kinase
MVRALLVLEKEKVIHRDIKTKNIFITANGTYKLGFIFFILCYLFIFKTR